MRLSPNQLELLKESRRWSLVSAGHRGLVLRMRALERMGLVTVKELLFFGKRYFKVRATLLGLGRVSGGTRKGA